MISRLARGRARRTPIGSRAGLGLYDGLRYAWSEVRRQPMATA